MSIQNAYDDWSGSYDTDINLTRDLDADVLRKILGTQSGGVTLEIGCGTGKNTPFLSQISASVMALDFSAGMLRQAQMKFAASNVNFGRADLLRPWPIQSACVERVVCDLVLEHIADLPHIFSEAYRCLQPGGCFFIAELHPFKQYLGSKANFQSGSSQIQIQAFVHHISEFLGAGRNSGLILNDLQEWWHAEDQNKPPRLISLLFIKPIK